ncbi:hypothetical protein QS306_09265 [Paraburkholderia bonniea]|uniref:hypothetical protein n=1 Tax=Paraburkholderia bonniea TaxID=2152891 RepID=UPI0025727126|nr:hypothetical protein [Paraburkholderia bonniea]WJF89311.1 hypothetical protein QS306_09265 [Paraburkholderia bonniea]WJF92627.1 hypothetical protein QS308_09275 [Paraburkholderia bonniea]
MSINNVTKPSTTTSGLVQSVNDVNNIGPIQEENPGPNRANGANHHTPTKPILASLDERQDDITQALERNSGAQHSAHLTRLPQSIATELAANITKGLPTASTQNYSAAETHFKTLINTVMIDHARSRDGQSPLRFEGQTAEAYCGRPPTSSETFDEDASRATLCMAFHKLASNIVAGSPLNGEALNCAILNVKIRLAACASQEGAEAERRILQHCKPWKGVNFMSAKGSEKRHEIHLHLDPNNQQGLVTHSGIRLNIWAAGEAPETSNGEIKCLRYDPSKTFWAVRSQYRVNQTGDMLTLDPEIILKTAAVPLALPGTAPGAALRTIDKVMLRFPAINKLKLFSGDDGFTTQADWALYQAFASKLEETATPVDLNALSLALKAINQRLGEPEPAKAYAYLAYDLNEVSKNPLQKQTVETLRNLLEEVAKFYVRLKESEANPAWQHLAGAALHKINHELSKLTNQSSERSAPTSAKSIPSERHSR